MKPRDLFLFLTFALLIIILFQNIEGISIQLLFWHITMPKIAFILTFFLFGGAAGYWLAKGRY